MADLGWGAGGRGVFFVCDVKSSVFLCYIEMMLYICAEEVEIGVRSF